jgi:hypothetical protein
MAYEDEITAANRLPTREARLAARNAVRAKYGMASEEKRRGGLAGFYDRNKQLIQAGLPTLAGMFIPGGGALAGAITGGLARGLDRPGQGGVALNLGQAARGAATGATLGSLGEKFSPFKPSMGAPAPAPTPAPTPASTAATRTSADARGMLAGAGDQRDLVTQAMQSGRAMPAPTPSITSASTATSRMTDVPGLRFEDIANANVVGTPRSLGSRAMSALLQPEVLAPVSGAVADVIGSAQDRAVRERQLALEEERMRREQESQERLAQLLMPLFQQTASQYGRTR